MRLLYVTRYDRLHQRSKALTKECNMSRDIFIVYHLNHENPPAICTMSPSKALRVAKEIEHPIIDHMIIDESPCKIISHYDMIEFYRRNC